MSSVEKVISDIEKKKFFAILRGIKADNVLRVTENLVLGGVNLLEVTFRSKDELENTIKSIRLIREEFGDIVTVGAGTVTTLTQVNAVKDVGGEFIVSPNTDEKVIEFSVSSGLVSIPGAMTPSEVMRGHNSGAHCIKIFPADSMGAKYISTLKKIFPTIKLVATGGISHLNAVEYLESGAFALGIGASLVDSKINETLDFIEIKNRAELLINSIEK
ncbi:bifunctional 4-hydroxy-2-oxoglutarate aldolase/2-dehydro-3-deoxy-phosphogluconate aldolase [Marinobacterium sedimentorum]|uniref:bifunctional 4-hydroxy-2-oxoglutarate aldolase/2-dehydro-3-deoxy-phosphogluconate aldolase n=1 Tax=Marinobacterium sedimentorum TaxID=2927804 RepID=UPI0020C65AA2|nr:bifunctional 4-hydroxy-2-oxoglutarate aldolase/2-dehydro-3-deoxy-phosphogluconate aldolase [Marinobacterium sedimentorum]MCP8689505.1 bifunctional 4-hydroxy-2-oxoglutarate aldolase/2-dehydro-3-deoxy-phosphogluconate aldolase [Marinobacterium sedimentorum]